MKRISTTTTTITTGNGAG
ncbi:thr operon leader peptide [Escherichia coli]|nr:thr operon leader peptide [Escherichia coli]